MNPALIGNDLFAETAKGLAGYINGAPFPSRALSHMGLNRAFRRKLTAKAVKGQVTPSDIPVWVVAGFITGGIRAA